MLKLFPVLSLIVHTVIYSIFRREFFGWIFIESVRFMHRLSLIVKNILCKCIVMFYRFTGATSHTKRTSHVDESPKQ